MDFFFGKLKVGFEFIDKKMLHHVVFDLQFNKNGMDLKRMVAIGSLGLAATAGGCENDPREMEEERMQRKVETVDAINTVLKDMNLQKLVATTITTENLEHICYSGFHICNIPLKSEESNPVRPFVSLSCDSYDTRPDVCIVKGFEFLDERNEVMRGIQ